MNNSQQKPCRPKIFIHERRLFMVFEMWSLTHVLYMCSPFIIFAIIYLLMRNRSNKAKNIVGYILGAISILILVTRNVDIYIREGWNAEVIPLQVCHIGSLIAGLALIFKKKWLVLTAFCFNMIPAFLAMIFASSLANYDNLLKIRAQAYVWGHIFIIVCALYAVMLYRQKFTRSDLFKALGFVGTMSALAILCNSLFRKLFDWTPNYFYLFSYEGTPMKFLYDVAPPSRYGWFEINWFYTVSVFAIFGSVFVGMYFLAKLLSKCSRS